MKTFLAWVKAYTQAFHLLWLTYRFRRAIHKKYGSYPETVIQIDGEMVAYALGGKPGYKGLDEMPRETIDNIRNASTVETLDELMRD